MRDTPKYNERTCRPKVKIGVWYGLAVLMLFMQPLFYNLLTWNISYIIFIVGFLFSIYLFIMDGGRKFNPRSLGFHGTWLIVGAYALVSFILCRGNSFSSVVIFVMSILLMLCAANSTKWIAPGIKVLLGMLSVFLVSTILMYIFPSLSDLLGSTLFKASNNFMGYQSGITAHYSNNGQFNAIGAVISLCFFIMGKSRPIRVSGGLLSAAFFVALVLTEKRTALVCAIVAAVAVYLSSNRENKLRNTIVLFLVAAALVVVFGMNIPAIKSVIDRFYDALSSGNLRHATSGRTLLWDYAIKGWLASPVFGNGWGSYHYIWPNGTTESFVAHNELLQLLYETGIVGTALTITCMCAALATTIKLVSVASVRVDELNIRVALGIQVFTLFYGFTMGGILYSPTYFCFYIFSIAVMLSYRRAVQLQGASANKWFSILDI